MTDAGHEYLHPGYKKPYPVEIVLRDLAAQEGCDGEPYDAMVFAAATITTLRAQLAEARAERDTMKVTYEELYADALADAKSDAQDFEGDLWKEVRDLIDDLGYDWSGDVIEYGVTADEAMLFIRDELDSHITRADRAEAALAAQIEAGAWQPIETAPKDGTFFLAWFSSRKKHCVAWRRKHIIDGDLWASFLDVYPDRWSSQPTHWMPLPNPPPNQPHDRTALDRYREKVLREAYDSLIDSLAAQCEAMTAENKMLRDAITDLRAQLAEARAGELAWAETAKIHLKAEQAFLSWLRDAGEHLRTEGVTICDDGTDSGEVLAAKVAECVGLLKARAERAEAALAAQIELETCGNCMGSGCGGHPDSGYVCLACNGSGGVRNQPHDRTALDRHDAQTREKALREAAALFETPNGRSYIGEITSNAILALIEKDKTE